MKYSVCADSFFQGKDFIEGVKTLHALGVRDIEFWSAENKDINALSALTETLGMNVVAFSTRTVSLTDPSQHGAYLEGLTASIETAKKLHCTKLITIVGDDTGAPRSVQHSAIVAGIKACVPLLERAGITLLVEPLNLTVDHIGYYLGASAEAFQIIDEVNSPRVKVLFDIYHQQINEGNILRNALPNLEKIGHFHAAGSCGRHELYRGELNYDYVLEKIRESGYNEYIGLEYFPTDPIEKGLSRYFRADVK